MSESFPTFKRAASGLDRALLWMLLAFHRKKRRLLLIVILLLAVHLACLLITGQMLDSAINYAGEMDAQTSFPVPSNINEGGDDRLVIQLYMQAFCNLRVSFNDFALWSGRGRNDFNQSPTLSDSYKVWGPEWTALARRLVACNGESLQLLAKAVNTRGYFSINKINHEPGDFNAYFSFNKARRLLEARATVLNADGKPDEALKSCEAILRMMDQIQEPSPPQPDTFRKSIGYNLVAVQAIAKLLERSNPSPEACRKLFDYFAASNVRAQALAEFRNRIWEDGDKIFGQVQEGNLQDIESSYGGQHFLNRLDHQMLYSEANISHALLNLDKMAYFRRIGRIYKETGLSWPDSFRQLEKEEKQVQAAYLTPVAKLTLVTFEPQESLQFYVADIAQFEACQIALALKAYKGEHGQYPENLIQLEKAGWKLPLDPFTSKPFRYRKDGNGFLVYSVGPDMHDNGGRPHHTGSLRGKPAPEYDFPFRASM